MSSKENFVMSDSVCEIISSNFKLKLIWFSNLMLFLGYFYTLKIYIYITHNKKSFTFKDILQSLPFIYPLKTSLNHWKAYPA